MTRELRVLPLLGIPELVENDDLGALVVDAAVRAGGLEDGDVVVVAQKAVSKVEGRIVHLDDVEPSPRARELAGDADPRRVEVVLRESREVVRARPPLVIAETRHGFVCASAGVDGQQDERPGAFRVGRVDPGGGADEAVARLGDDEWRARTDDLP